VAHFLGVELFVTFVYCSAGSRNFPIGPELNITDLSVVFSQATQPADATATILSGIM